jgi:hypothetical protein
MQLHRNSPRSRASHSVVGVFHPGKGVVAPHVVQLGLIHLPGEPLAAVETDVDAEGEPGLDAACMKPKTG